MISKTNIVMKTDRTKQQPSIQTYFPGLTKKIEVLKKGEFGPPKRIGNSPMV